MSALPTQDSTRPNEHPNPAPDPGPTHLPALQAAHEPTFPGTPSAAMAPETAPSTLTQLRSWAQAGWLRRLDAELAAYLADLSAQLAAEHAVDLAAASRANLGGDQAAGTDRLMMAAALLSHAEGQGHTCLPLAYLKNSLQSGDAVGRRNISGEPAHRWNVSGEPASRWNVSGLAPAALSALDDWFSRQFTEQSVHQPEPDFWLHALHHSPVVRCLPAPDHGQPLVLAQAESATNARLYLRRHWMEEAQVARNLTQRLTRHAAPPPDGALAQEPNRASRLATGATPINQDISAGAIRLWLDRLFPALGPAIKPPGQEAESGEAARTAVDAQPVDWQKLACAIALRGRFAVITGGPGTGKTYTAARLLAALLATAPDPARLRVALAAPTGKAAARLKQSIEQALAELAGRLGHELNLPDLVQRLQARTLHALLGARPGTRAFAFNARHPLDVDVLIVDEASMVHLEMMAALLAALPPGARLVLLGDKDQLASVEAGAVLGDLCRQAETGGYDAATRQFAAEAAGITLPDRFLAPAGAAPDALAQQIVMLRESRRFGGPIGQLALAVNRGEASTAARLLATSASNYPLAARFGHSPQAAVDLAVNGRAGAEGGYRSYLELLAQGPATHATSAADSKTADTPHQAWVKAVLRAFERFRLLCAVREGEWGTAGLNRAVSQALAHAGLLRPVGEWYPGRPVMVTRNDPALGVFNGDIGIVLPSPTSSTSSADGRGATVTDTKADRSTPRLRVWFLDGEHLRSVACSRLAQVETAFAMTVHKSQGSEFDHTVLVLPPHGGVLLGRELVYTGITRARSAFSLVAPEKEIFLDALERVTMRASGLSQI